MRSILEDEVQLERQEPTAPQIELQHINLKLWLKDSENLDLELIIPVFHSWIQNQPFDELLLDVADYRHVPDGPGVLLIGHEADYSIDQTDGRPGVKYNRKALVEGSNQDRLTQAARAALVAARRLEEDAALERKLCFNGRDIEVWINDRLLAPNRAETRKTVEPEFQTFFDRLFVGHEYSLSFSSDPTKDSRRLFGASISSKRAFAVTELLDNLASR